MLSCYLFGRVLNNNFQLFDPCVSCEWTRTCACAHLQMFLTSRCALELLENCMKQQLLHPCVSCECICACTHSQMFLTPSCTLELLENCVKQQLLHLALWLFTFSFTLRACAESVFTWCSVYDAAYCNCAGQHWEWRRVHRTGRVCTQHCCPGRSSIQVTYHAALMLCIPGEGSGGAGGRGVLL